MATFRLRVSQILTGLLLAAGLAATGVAHAQEGHPDGTYTVAGRDGFVTVGASGENLSLSGVLDDGVSRQLQGSHPTTTAADGTASVDSSSWVLPVQDPAAWGQVVRVRPAGDGLDVTRELGGDVLGRVHLTKIRLVLYPGETRDDSGTTFGKIYVVGGRGESYEIAAGPPPGQGGSGPGGHHAGVTPAGSYVLSPQEHHVTVAWPNSTIPWGAVLAKRDDGFVWYQASAGADWVQVTGPKGVMTESLQLFWDRSSAAQRADMGTRDEWSSDTSALYDQNGQLVSPWNLNDFGNWAWDLVHLDGERSPFYLHTTPDDEALFAAGQPTVLVNSHGCVHLHPPDRDDMMGKGYLAGGVDVRVMPYGEKGPPAP